MTYDSALACALAAFALAAAAFSYNWLASILALLVSAVPAFNMAGAWRGNDLTVFRAASNVFPSLPLNHHMAAPAAMVFLVFAPGMILAQKGRVTSNAWLASRLATICGALMLSVGALPLIGLAARIHPFDELVPVFGDSGVPCGFASCLLGAGILLITRRRQAGGESRLVMLTAISAVFSAVVCSTVVGAAFLGMDAETAAGEWVAQTYQAISAIESVRLAANMESAETGQALSEVARLVADDPAQATRVESLQHLFAAGAAHTPAFSAGLRSLLDRERLLLGERAATRRLGADLLKRMVVSALLLYALITALSATALWREISRRRSAQSELLKQRDDLETRVDERTRELKKFADTLRDREQQFRATFDAAAVGLAHVGPDGQLLRVNNELCRITGYSRKELEQMNFFDITHPDDVDAEREHARALVAGEVSQFVMEKRHRHRNGHWVWVNLTSSLVHATRGDYSVSVLEDITPRKWAEEALRDSEQRFKAMADAMPQIVWTATPHGNFDYRNRRWYEFTGCPAETHPDHIWKSILHPDDLALWTEKWRVAVLTGRACHLHCRLWDRESGTHKWFLARAVPTRNDDGEIVRWYGTCTDIDDHQKLSQELERRVEQRTSELRQSVAEKEILLKEVHHRVKNNLQIVSSLLTMQMETALGDAADCLLQANQRVQSMALIHQQIYESPTLSDIDFSEYIEELSWQLFQTYCVDPERIQLQVDVRPVRLDIDQAIPCGLILNELVSNALKHAFPGSRAGRVHIRLYPDSAGGVYFAVSDDGVGLPKDFQIGAGRSLGMHVARILANQLGSVLDISSGSETTFSIQFKAEIPLAA
jgi:PAS domain S-box-containing protein